MSNKKNRKNLIAEVSKEEHMWARKLAKKKKITVSKIIRKAHGLGTTKKEIKDWHTHFKQDKHLFE